MGGGRVGGTVVVGHVCHEAVCQLLDGLFVVVVLALEAVVAEVERLGRPQRGVTAVVMLLLLSEAGVVAAFPSGIVLLLS